MARSIDERVVQMRFDNKQFEQNAQTTLGTLGRLKDALNNSNAPAKAFEDIGRAASRMDLSSIGVAVDEISHRFSAMGIVGMTVLQDLTRSAIGMAKSLADKTIGQITSGGYSRAQKIEDARFTLQGLLKDEKEVEAVMENVDGAVSGTAYGYDEAASIAAQFAASGQRAGETMEANLRAVAGVAAMTNSTYSEIGHIFATVSGQGKLMGMQLQQLSNRGMNAAATLAEYLGTTEDDVRELVTKGKIDFQTFADAMYDAFGDQAGKANETFTGVLKNIKSALSRTGQGFYAPLIKQNSTLVKMLQTVRTLISDTFNKSEFWVGVQEDVTTTLLDLFKMTDEWLQSIDFDTIIKGLGTLYQGAKDVASIIYSLGDFFYGFWIEVAGDPVTAKSFLTWTQSVRDAIRSFKTSLEDLDNNGFRMIMRSVYGFVIQPFMIMVELLKDLWEITAPIRTTFVELAKLFSEVGRILNHVTYNLLWDIRDAGNVFTGFGDIIADVFGRVNRTLQDWQDILREWSPEIIETLSSLDIAKGFDAMAGAIKNVIASFKPFEKLKTAVTTVVDFITTYLTKAKTTVIEFWNSFKAGDASIVDVFKKIFGHIGRAVFDGLNQITSNFHPLQNVATIIKNVIEIIEEGFGISLDTVKNLLGEFLNAISFDNVSEEFSTPTEKLKKGLIALLKIFKFVATTVGKIIKPVVNSIGTLFKSLTLEDVKAASLILLINRLGNAFTFLVRNTSATIGTFKRIPQMFKGLPPLVNFSNSMFNAFQPMARLQKEIDSKLVINIAAAFAILAGSLFLLSLVPPDRLMNSAVALGMVAAILAATTSVFKEFTKLPTNPKNNKFNTAGFVMVILGISASLAILASAVKKMGELDSNGLARGLIGLAVIFSVLEKSLSALTKMPFGDIKLSSFVVSLIAMTLALSILSKAVKRMGNLSLEQLVIGLTGLGLVMFAMVRAMDALTKIRIPVIDSGRFLATILGLSVAVLLISSAVKRIGKLSLEELTIGITGMVLSVITLVKATEALNTMNGKAKGLGTLLLVAISMSMISRAIKRLGKMDFATLMSAVLALTMAMAPLMVLTILVEDVDDRNLIGLAAMIFGIVALTKAIGKIAKTTDPIALSMAGGIIAVLLTLIGSIVLAMAYLSGKMTFNYAAMGMMMASLVLMSGTIISIAPALAMLSMFKPEKIVGAAVAISMIMTTMAAVAALSKYTGSGIGIAASMIVLAIAINVLTPALMLLGSNALAAALGMGVIAVGIWAIAQAGMALTGAIPGLLALGATLLMAGVGAAAFGSGIFLTVSALMMFVAEAALVAGGISLIVTTVVKLVPVMATSIVLALTILVTGFVKLIPIVIRGVAEAAAEILQIIIDYTPIISLAMLRLGFALLSALRELIPGIVEVAVELIVTLVQTINKYGPVLAQALFDLVIGLINGVADLIRNNYEQVFAAVGNLLSAIFEMIISLVQEFLNMIPGVGDKLSGLLDKPKQMLKDAATGGEMESAGADLADSVADGVNSSNAPEEAGQGILDKIKNGLGLGEEGGASLLGGDFMSQFTQGINGFDMSGAGAGMYENLASGFTGGVDGTGAFGLGSTMGGQINEGIVSSSEESRSAGQTLSTSVIEGATNDEGFAEAGRTNVQSFIGGMEAEGENVTTAGSQVAQKGLDGADKEDEWKGLGKDAASGFASGIDANNYLASTAGRKLGNAAYTAAQKALDSHSPSRKFAELGKFSAVGYSGAVAKFTYLAEDATSSMGDAAVASLSAAMGNIGGIMDNVDYQPTIAPVLDLSSVQNGTQNIGTMFDRNRSLAAQAGYTFDANMQSETESLLRSLAAQSDVLASIRDLLASQEIRLDTGQLVGGMASRMDSALGVRAIRAGRGS